MRIGFAYAINLWDDIRLNRLILENRKRYADFLGCINFYESTTPENGEDPSWRHPRIILKALKMKEFKDVDFIINSGSNNIVTNFNITPCSMIEKYMGDHEMILQSFHLNPHAIPVVLESNGVNKPLKPKFLTEPYFAIMGE